MTAGAPGKSLLKRLPSWAVLLISIALLVTALFAAAGIATRTTPEDLRAQQGEGAERIRVAANLACANGLFRDCLGLYNQARHLDPAGDTDPAVVRNRAYALQMIADSAPLPSDASADGEAPRPEP